MQEEETGNAIIIFQHAQTKMLLLQQVSCYLPTLHAGVCEKGKMQKEKKKKIGQWPCSESQRALLMLSGDKQNQTKVLPDVP